MQRRDFLQVTAGALLAAPRGLHAKAPLAPPQQTASSDAGRLKIDIYSRHLQWLRTADEVAEAAVRWATTASTSR